MTDDLTLKLHRQIQVAVAEQSLKTIGRFLRIATVIITHLDFTNRYNGLQYATNIFLAQSIHRNASF